MRKNFIKKEENFVCEICEKEVVGSGYRNHCPSCLYSLHVDVEVPGDRMSTCQGIMEPTGIEESGGKFIIIHKFSVNQGLYFISTFYIE